MRLDELGQVYLLFVWLYSLVQRQTQDALCVYRRELCSILLLRDAQLMMIVRLHA
jgi:hypothetical protein